MSSSMRALLAGLLLVFLFPGRASADNFTIPDPFTGYDSTLRHRTGASGFTDTYTFLMPSGHDGISGDFYYANITPGASGVLRLLDSGNNLLSAWNWTPGTYNYSAFGLTAGETYKLRVRGTPIARDGWYQFHASPAPEPHEWVLLLAGLGIVVASARRRRRAVQVPASV
ncbi:MAG: PEP-CTERM sorting domain-containing protein [Betaproteobacteria bacterium]|nr:PEP-CTERM sorting domain-containing protein [Betaproteobacteria bacterium]